ncbi:class I SAM-dependent methyltransferase [Virgibacillus kekensis]|uniref:Class I SAM-dependent methyltransferase n=1 Tax=Virgibacillus kekensis TaxID=202261 RepID=A0ABV9DLI9_9BACI
MTLYEDNLFKGAAEYYSRYRPMYPTSLVRALVKKFELDGQGKMLDLGCGPGRLAIRFSDWFEEIVGIDKEPEMIEEAKRISNEARVENTRWFTGDIEEYKGQSDDRLRLITMAKSFHWMDRKVTLDTLYLLVTDGGGVAIIDDYSPDKELLPWQQKVEEVRKHWYGEERKAGNTTYSHPSVSHQEIVADSQFEMEIHQLPAHEHIWTIESIIGNLYSTSYGAKRFLGKRAEPFETHLREELLAIDSSGVFKEDIEIKVILGLKRGN